jgi:hypothetical protein
MGHVCAVLMHLGTPSGRLVLVPEQKVLAHRVFTRPRPEGDRDEGHLYVRPVVWFPAIDV